MAARITTYERFMRHSQLRQRSAIDEHILWWEREMGEGAPHREGSGDRKCDRIRD